MQILLWQAIIFIIQTDEAKYFTPNRKTHPDFADALSDAEKSGVKILCLCCTVSADEIFVKESVNYIID